MPIPQLSPEYQLPFTNTKNKNPYHLPLPSTPDHYFLFWTRSLVLLPLDSLLPNCAFIFCIPHINHCFCIHNLWLFLLTWKPLNFTHMVENYMTLSFYHCIIFCFIYILQHIHSSVVGLLSYFYIVIIEYIVQGKWVCAYILFHSYFSYNVLHKFLFFFWLHSL